MTDAKPFSLAVVKGASRGGVLRTDKKRISVGSAKDNDLVVADPDISPRHFLVLIDQGRWRIHTFSPDKSITVDRRWYHPISRARGALITAASAEILLFPGDLEQGVIDEEVTKREGETGPVLAITEGDRKLITQIFEKPIEFQTTAEEAAERTVSIDPANMATITGDRPPEDIRLAARSRLAEERRDSGMSPTSVSGNWEEPTVGMEWQNGQPVVRPINSVPEVIPEPEGQLMRTLGSESSVMVVRPELDSFDGDASMLPTPQTPQLAIETPPLARNAWGETPEGRPSRTPRPSTSTNAWGDAGRKPRAQAAIGERAREPRTNAWGDPGRRAVEQKNGAPVRPQDRADRGAIGRVLAIEHLAKSSDPALAILRDPDGELATSTRLLGTRLEEAMRTLGYRAYMISSSEPLTGKTTAACNLALALAEDTHRRIALIEANFRYPRFAEIFGTPDDYGLIPLLGGRVQLGDAIAKIADRNLVILPAGGRHPSPAELLSSPRFKALIAELANTVDIALIDAPSVTPFADANILLPLVDAALLVVSDKKTQSTWIERALDQLGEARVLGAVYNQIPKAKLKELRPELKERMRQNGRS
jgi:capsular exopolysaccharide synthesis family protein